MTFRKCCSLFLLVLLSIGARADINAVTDDGKRVRLLDDQSWRYLTEEESAAVAAAAVAAAAAAAEGDSEDEEAEVEIEESLLLTVEKRIDGTRSCKLGMRLKNNSAHKVSSLVPQLSAYTNEGIRFETVFVSFHDIKPTLSQYAEAKIKGLACQDIEMIKVHGGDRCKFGSLDKYNATKGECLAQVEVAASDLIAIVREYGLSD